MSWVQWSVDRRVVLKDDPLAEGTDMTRVLLTVGLLAGRSVDSMACRLADLKVVLTADWKEEQSVELMAATTVDKMAVKMVR